MYFHLDGREATSRASLHALLRRGLNLPAYCGRSLDALYDCMSELRETTVVEIVHCGALRAALGDYAQRFLETLRDSGVALILHD